MAELPDKSCAVENGKSNPCLRQGKPGEMLPGQPSYPTAKASWGPEHDGEAGVRANMPDPTLRKARAIWSKLDCLKPNLQLMQAAIHRKDA